nr:gibberellin-regulated protein 14 [Equus caballus]
MYKRWAGAEHPKPLGICRLQSLVNLVAHPAQNVSAEAEAVCSPEAALPSTSAVLPPTPTVLPPTPTVLPPTSADQAALPASTQVPAEMPTASAVPEVQAEVSPRACDQRLSPQGPQSA